MKATRITRSGSNGHLRSYAEGQAGCRKGRVVRVDVGTVAAGRPGSVVLEGEVGIIGLRQGILFADLIYLVAICPYQRTRIEVTLPAACTTRRNVSLGW
jgi:hypothetical protein